MGRCCRFLSSSNTCNIKTPYKQFFTKLSFELEGPTNVLKPAQNYGTFERKYLRIYVHNKGYAVAHDCTAELYVLKTGDLKQLCWDGMNLLTDISIKRKIGIGGREILHIVFSDSRSIEDYGYISTMSSIANPNVIRMEDAYNHDFDINILVRTEGGAYCQATIQIHPHSDFKSIDMILKSKESGHLKLKKSKDRLKQTFGHMKNLTTRMHL